MKDTGRDTSRLLRTAAALSFLLSPLYFATTAAFAQESGHLRVQFSDGAAWSNIGSSDGANAPLPPGPAQAAYDPSHNARAFEPATHLRVKPLHYNGM